MAQQEHKKPKTNLERNPTPSNVTDARERKPKTKQNQTTMKYHP
jgi:hypothetical protein